MKRSVECHFCNTSQESRREFLSVPTYSSKSPHSDPISLSTFFFNYRIFLVNFQIPTILFYIPSGPFDMSVYILVDD